LSFGKRFLINLHFTKLHILCQPKNADEFFSSASNLLPY
jgi:hypothetical protein